ncbi:hypothetical protein CIL03_11275 [Virgibacillus indicus]|uniref:ABC-three component systems C-terminal domain-containing protein n=1 Tax=Virgibacillus indicus TaxID=2024554 RepID=A0A265N875_9BACI|nr:ABC-three component system protein [Virgibacillus indicus]OZU88228.1 hypothetical protein CIL03_11275 [Virgibacillus indicus]
MSKRNATASWSGYLHQGKVGILVALREINQLLDLDQDLNGWLVEFESAEDIDIKHGKKVISRHQVKAYKDKVYPNDYKDVLSKQTFIEKDGIRKIDTPGFQICNINTGKLEVDENSRFLHTITEVKGFELNKKAFKHTYPRNTYIENPNKIKLYIYPDRKKHCKLSSGQDDKILDFCKVEIKNLINRMDGHPFKDSDEEHKNKFKHLLGILDIQIRQKHIKGISHFPTLKFEEIFNVITDKKKYKQKNVEVMREMFGVSWTEFIQETQDDQDFNYKDNQIEKVNNIIEELYSMDDDKLIQFIKDINPDKNKSGDFSDINDVIALCDINAFKDVFYECLVAVTENDFNIDFKGYQGLEESDDYLLTLINRKKSKTGIVVANMTRNKGVTDEIFNRRYLINGQIDQVPFGDFIQQNYNATTLDTNWKRPVTEKEIFYNPNLEFISVDNAIEQLNKKGGKS